MKNTIFIIMVLTIFIPSLLFADTQVSFKWIKSNDIQGGGYKIIMDKKTNVIGDINNPDTTTFSYNITDDSKCHVFSIFAYKGEKESDLGNLVNWCPPKTMPPAKFEITIKQIQ